MKNNRGASVLANETKWYQLTVDEAFKRLSAGSSGLTTSEAKARLERFGYNEIKFKKRSPLVRFLLQFHNPLIYVLLVAGTITGILSLRGEDMVGDTAVILGVVLLNVIIGFVQEGKGEAAIEALQRMMVPECTVLRDGERQVIPARELVPGDVVLLEGGDKVPADLRLFSVKNLHVDEAALTGESVPVTKVDSSIARPNLTPGDQRSMAFSGTFATQGRGTGIVVATGEQTEFGKIARLMKETRKITTPLMRKIAAFTRFLIFAILALAAVNFIAAVVFKYDLVYSFLASVSLAVAAIPEMLPAILAAILALAAVAMAKRNALIRKLPAAETLGVATVICSDKTGTLTKNQMTVVHIYTGGRDYEVTGVGYGPSGEFILKGKRTNPVPENRELLETLRAGYQCSDASLVMNKGEPGIVGDPTEGALVVSAAKAGITQRSTRLDEIPFESEQQYMATLHQGQDKNIIYVKGSPEKVLRMCQSQLIDGYTEPLRSQEVLAKADEMASNALRVLGMAYKVVPKVQGLLSTEDMTGLTFLGLQGMIDPPREEAIEAVRKCKKAGIRPVMITGDHAQTARAIARQLGIASSGDGVLTGEELARMTDDELYEAVSRVSVYARVAPEHKLRITKQLQKRGHITAVTGDGVNDAPALKAADIGVAMGITGTEVSKEAADMVLADDNFASIVNAVEEGRHAWKNLEKAILYTLPTNGGQALLVMGAILLAPFFALFALRLPLEPIQILWINLFDSVFLTMPLMMEPKEKGLLNVPPRSPKEKIANRLFFVRVGLVSLVMAATGFIVYWTYGHLAISGGVNELALTQAQSAAFISVVLVHIGFIFTARSIFDSAFTFSPFSNKWVLWGVGITIVTNLMIVYVPFLNTVFRTAPFPVEWWSLIIFALLPGFLVVELEKLIRKRLKRS
ncbi:putative cation-transporting ATPase F [subsurface metagenome]